MQESQTKIYRKQNKIYTKNADSGEKVYGEQLLTEEGKQYRNWQPSRSKAGAAVMKGVNLGISHDDEVLYLGAASGTTVSHFSDIVQEGFIYAVEYSDTVIKKLVELAEKRENIAPILGDARKPEEYEEMVQGEVDVVFQDISQSDQPEIFLKNAEKFLKPNGIGLIAIKAHSISTSKEESKIFEEVKEKLTQKFEIKKEKMLEPYEKNHLFLKMRYKQ
ncbi:fibrillarin-like rRNA/tRNA 2'-O-methyltransferase [Candidatus Nanohalobium constans]|uniref:Fibrillarin-like rRNA/tRNA 2'-O-methyltransferase n=1 Tax=Candidatus Nanohalobium constans TaxID=2565781 RepID=A0A5Q0UF25_9ARCH|nr:fibrillarin-like rRNA/tRNA 2'-O-methyltransferase [Candidatus Nanohalobium constans]QGA80158.1 fibrillarin-like pre-rRNA processing protein [Candidatus Nanohalobium constans]